MSDRTSEESDSSSAFSGLSVMISPSLCTTIPVTISAIASRFPKFSALVVALPWLEGCDYRGRRDICDPWFAFYRQVAPREENVADLIERKVAAGRHMIRKL